MSIIVKADKTYVTYTKIRSQILVQILGLEIYSIISYELSFRFFSYGDFYW